MSYPISEKVKIDIYDEILLNVKGSQTFNQNWLGGGFTYKFDDHLRGRIGYQNIQMRGPDFDRILLGFYYTPDFTKKDKKE